MDGPGRSGRLRAHGRWGGRQCRQETCSRIPRTFSLRESPSSDHGGREQDRPASPTPGGGSGKSCPRPRSRAGVQRQSQHLQGTSVLWRACGDPVTIPAPLASALSARLGERFPSAPALKGVTKGVTPPGENTQGTGWCLNRLLSGRLDPWNQTGRGDWGLLRPSLALLTTDPIGPNAIRGNSQHVAG